MHHICNGLPRPNDLSAEFKNQYLDITTGCMQLWLCTAMWNAPFLNGNNLSFWLRVPSGKTNNLAPFAVIASDSWFNFAKASFERFINNVPHKYDAWPNGKAYNSSRLATTVARPITGHKYANTAYAYIYISVGSVDLKIKSKKGRREKKQNKQTEEWIWNERESKKKGINLNCFFFSRIYLHTWMIIIIIIYIARRINCRICVFIFAWIIIVYM